MEAVRAGEPRRCVIGGFIFPRTRLVACNSVSDQRRASHSNRCQQESSTVSVRAWFFDMRGIDSFFSIVAFGSPDDDGVPA